MLGVVSRKLGILLVSPPKKNALDESQPDTSMPISAGTFPGGLSLVLELLDQHLDGVIQLLPDELRGCEKIDFR